MDRDYDGLKQKGKLAGVGKICAELEARVPIVICDYSTTSKHLKDSKSNVESFKVLHVRVVATGRHL